MREIVNAVIMGTIAVGGAFLLAAAWLAALEWAERRMDARDSEAWASEGDSENYVTSQERRQG
jgi:hypothetical protein